jgi:hypothetical protein
VRREKRERSLNSTTSSEIEREIFEFCDLIRICIMLVFPAAIYYCSLLLTQTHTFEFRNLIRVGLMLALHFLLQLLEQQ